MVSASSTPTSHNRNKTDLQATVVYVGSRLFVPESTADFLDCVTKDPELAASKVGLTLLCPGSSLGGKSFSRLSLPVFVLAK